MHFSLQRPLTIAHRSCNIVLNSCRGYLLFLLILALGAGQARAQYCVPAYTMGCGTGVLIHTFAMTGTAGTAIRDSASACAPGGYSDSSAISSVTLAQGGTYTAYVSSFSTPACIQIWIDLNNNFSFEATEVVGGLNGVAFDPALSGVTINIPATAPTGSHRMRAALGSGTSYSSLLACPMPPMSTQGEVHDYTVVITAASSSCGAITGLAASSITSSGASITWTAASGSAGYQYVINTSSADPATSGAYTASASYTATGLSPATNYYAHVRDTCGPGNLSAWATIPFTTLSAATCGAVTGLTASGVTNTAATISWTAVSSSAGYKYVIDNISTAPTGFGTYVSGTSVSPTSLTPSTVYYAHVRDTCGAGNVSSWVTISFTTTATAPSCSPVSALAATGVTGSGATISWTAIGGVAGYKYVVNTTAADPTVPGSFTTLNSVPITGLSSGTTYYAHVRDSCGVGNVSSWVTISFHTTGTAIVTNAVNVNDGNLTVSPNPASGIAVVTFGGIVHGKATIQLMDMAGRLITTTEMISGKASIDLAALPAGLYLCRYTDTETTLTSRLMKQ